MQWRLCQEKQGHYPRGAGHLIASGIFDDSAAENVGHDPANQQLFVINGANKTVNILDISDPTNPTLIDIIDVTEDLKESGGVNSVDVRDGMVADAVEHENKQLPGWVAFYGIDGTYLNSIGAGALPDMLTFTHNGSYVLVANEGQPNDTYTVDPEGSVSIVDIRKGVMNATVAHADFAGFDDAAADAAGVRTPQPFGATVAQDLEPEYIATSHDSRTAWVTLQENNALAIVDIRSATVTGLTGLGWKDHSLPDKAWMPATGTVASTSPTGRSAASTCRMPLPPTAAGAPPGR